MFIRLTEQHHIINALCPQLIPIFYLVLKLKQWCSSDCMKCISNAFTLLEWLLFSEQASAVKSMLVNRALDMKNFFFYSFLVQASTPRVLSSIQYRPLPKVHFFKHLMLLSKLLWVFAPWFLGNWESIQGKVLLWECLGKGERCLA